MKKIIGGMMIAVAMMVAMSGCSPSKNETAGTEKALPETEIADTGKALPETEIAGAERALKGFAAAIGNGRLDELVGLLPASYAKDVGNIINAFAERMDAEMWNKGRDVASVFLNAIAAKAELITEMAEAADAPKIEVSALRDGGKALSAFVKGETMALDSLKKTDAMAFAKALTPATSAIAKGINTVVMDDIDLKQLKIEFSEKTSADTVDISVKGEVMTMKLVEGKWIPEDLADEWKSAMKEHFAGIREIDFTSDEGKETKQEILTAMGAIEPVLAQVDTVKTTEDIEQLAEAFFKAVGGQRAEATSMVAKGRAIALGTITKNIDNDALSRPDIWPETTNLASEGFSEAYFTYLMKQSRDFKWMMFAGDGIPAAANEEEFMAGGKNAWSYIAVENSRGNPPFLFTKNLRLTDDDLRRYAKGERISLSDRLDPSAKPFGDKRVIVTYRDASTAIISAEDLDSDDVVSMFFGGEDPTFYQNATIVHPRE